MALTQVSTNGIKDATIATADIADDAVTADKLANSINTEIAANTAKTTNATHTGEVTGSGALTIANDAVTSAKIADNAVVTAAINADAVTGAKIADDAVDGDKLADNITLAGTLTIPDTITHTGDTNTKIRFPAADTVSVEAAGIEKLRIEGDYAGTVDVKGHPAHFRLNSLRDTSDWDATDPIGKIDFYISGDTTNNLPYNAAFIHCLNETNNADEPSGALVFGTSTANASGGAVERFRIDQNGNISIPNDSGKFLAGAGSDLQIYHDGTHNYIKSGNDNQDIFIESTKDLYLKTGDGSTGTHTVIYAADNAGVALNYDNVKKFETTLAGTTTSGNATFTGHIYQGDNDAHFFGADNDITIYHDGSNNFFESNGANNWIKSPGTQGFASGNEYQLKCYANGAVELFYDNVKKLETSANGTVFSDSIFLPDSEAINFGAGNDLGIYHNGTDSYLINTTGVLHFRNDGEFKFQKNNGSFVGYINTDGATKWYYNGSVRIETTDYGFDTKTIKPDADNTHDLGASDQRWDDVYATNGTIQTSDRNAKKDIVKSDLGLTFINAVEPVSYKFKTGTRTHYGVIAQDLETVLDGKDFAGLTKDTETGNYGLRYTELISPLIKAVQELSAEVNTLKTEIAALKTA